MAARNMYRIEINIHEKLCVKLVIYKDHIKMQVNKIFKKNRNTAVKYNFISSLVSLLRKSEDEWPKYVALFLLSKMLSWLTATFACSKPATHIINSILPQHTF